MPKQDKFGGIALEEEAEQDEFGGLLISTDSPVAQPEASAGLTPPSDIQLPQWEPSLGQKLGLEPEKSASTFAGFESELNERTGDFFREAARFVPSALKTAGVIANDPWRASVNMGRGLLDFIAPGAMKFTGESGLTPPTTTPEQQPLYRAGAAIERGLEEAFPPPQEPELLREVVGGGGQMASMLAGGAGVRALGAGVKGTAAAATTLGAVQEFDDAFTRARKRGDDPDTALRKTLGYTTVASFLENRLGAGRILKQFFPSAVEAAKKLTAMGVSKKIIDNFITQGIEEGGQRFAQNWIVDEAPSLEGVGREALVGGLSGGVVALPAAGVQPQQGVIQPPVSTQQPLAAEQPDNVLRQAEAAFNQRTQDAVQQESTPIPGDVQQPEVAQEIQVEVPAEVGSETVAETRVEETPETIAEELGMVVRVQPSNVPGQKAGWDFKFKLPGVDMFSVVVPAGTSKSDIIKARDKKELLLKQLGEWPTTPEEIAKTANELQTAVRVGGKPISSPDKGHSAIADELKSREEKVEALLPENQGFTWRGEFISREDAAKILGRTGKLISEDLATIRKELATPVAESPVVETPVVSEPVPMAQGMGGASAGSAEFNTGTGLANAVGEQERIGFGLPEAYPTVSQKMLPVWNQSGLVLAQDPKAGEKLAAELKINPERGMTDLDSAILLRHKVALENAQNQAAEDSITAGTQEAKQEAMDRFDNISNQLLDLLDAAKFRGSQWGREGRWRQALAFEDYSLETMRRTKRMKADRELTPEEEAETKREHADIVAKQKTAEEARAKDEKKARDTQVKEEVADVVKTARTRKSKQAASGVVRDVAAEQTEIVNYLKEHFIENGDLSDARGSIRKLMELLVEFEGITERLPLETRVHEILSSVDPTLTREGTLDLMSGYGKSKLPSQEPSKKIVRDISQQIISVRKLLDYFKGQRPKLTGILRDAPSDIQRAWLRMVNEAKKNFKLDVPVDNARSIKSATDAINTRLKNRISDLRQEIATRHKIIRERSPSPYNSETLNLRFELEVLKAQHAEIFGSGLTPAQQLDRLERSAELQIEELERQIRTGEIFPKSKQALGLTSDKLDAAKAKIEELKLQRQFAREALQPRTEPEVAANEARVKALDKQIAAIEKQLADDAVFAKEKKPRTPSEDARVLEREKKLADLKQQRQFARERNQSQMEPHERFLLNYLLRIRQREAAYKERLATGAFEKTPKPKRDLGPDVLKALAAVEQAKSDFQRGLHQYELSRRSRLQKIWDGIKSARNAFVNIVSSYDFSAPRQAFFALLANTSRLVTNPVQGSKLLAVPFQNMFKAWSGEQRSQMIDQWRKNRPNALSGADKTAGIQYTDLHSTTFSKTEENARSVLDDWAKLPIRTGNVAKTAVTFLPKVGSKGVRMSNRAFVTYLNTTRALLFDELLRANFQDQAPTDAQLRVLGNIVNLSTGRGSLSPKTAEVASNILWAPSLLASRAQVLTGQPFWGKAGREGGLKSQGIVAKEYARWITSAALLFAVVRMFDEKDEDEPTSSDFGKVVRGKTRIDPWAGNQQLAVLMARIKQGQTTSIKGETREISGRQTGEVVWNFFKNKTRPDIVAAVNATIAAIDLGKKKKDVRVTPEEAIKGAVPVPLAVREIIEVMRDRGMTEGAIIEALGLFGAGVSVYEGREVQK